MKIQTTLVLLCIALAAPGIAVSNPDKHGDSRQSMARHANGDLSAMVLQKLVMATRRLDLSETQEANIHQILQQNKGEMTANRDASREAMAQLHGIISDSELDQEALAGVARKQGDLVSERIMLAGTVASRILSELDETQRAELKEMGQEMRELRREKGHRTARRGPPADE